MEIDWSTFLLEVINFLILVWILKRFFYAPVVAMLEKRRQTVEASLKDAEEKRNQAKQMEIKYEARLKEWEQERARARDALQKELAQEKDKALQELRAALDKERQRAEVLQARRFEQEKRAIEEQVIAQTGQFNRKLLGEVAGPELAARLAELFVKQLPTLGETQRATLRNVFRNNQPEVRISTSHELTETVRSQVTDALNELVGMAVSPQVSTDPALLAGIRVNMGPLVLGANLADELRFFLESAHEGG